MYLKRIAFLFLAFFSFALQTNPAAAAFSIEYQAAANPATQGFSTVTIPPAPRVLGPIADDLGYPAWSISGLGLSSQFGYLSGALTAAQKAEINSQGFTLTLRGRVLRENAPAYDAGSNTIIGGASVETGFRRYDIRLGIDHNGSTVAVLLTSHDASGPGGSIRGFGPSYTLNDAGYHTYDLVFNPNTQPPSARLFIDGVERISGYTGNGSFVGDRGLVFNATSGGGMNFNLVRLTSPAVVPVACNGLTGEALQTCSSYEFSLEQGTQKTESIQLINPGTVPRTATLDVINPHSDHLTVSLSQSNLSIAAGETKTLTISLEAGATPIGVYDDLLLKVTADDGSTLYSSIKVNVVSSGTGQQSDLTITANDLSSATNADGSVTLTATVHNRGNVPATNVPVRFYEFDNELTPPVTIAQISPKESGNASIIVPATAPAATPGDHLIRVVVDPASAIAEFDETNNEASRLISIGSSGPPTEGNILVTGSLPKTVYTGSLFTLSGSAVYDLYVNGVRNPDYVVKGGAVQITVGNTVYGAIHTDVNGNFAKTLQAPATPGTYHITMTVTDETFVGTRELEFTVIPVPTTPQPPPPPPTTSGSGHWNYDTPTGTWTWVWTTPPVNEPSLERDLRVFSEKIHFSKDNPEPHEEITLFAEIQYWATSSSLISDAATVNVYVTDLATNNKMPVGHTAINSLSVGRPDFGSRYVYATWKNQAAGIYLVEFEIVPSYSEYTGNNVATRAILVGQGQQGGVIAGQVTTPLGGVGGVKIQVFNADGTSIGNATTGPTGFYLVVNVPLGGAQVRITPPSGYLPDAATKTVTVSDGAVSTVDFHLTKQAADTTPPILSLPSPITAEATGPSGTAVTYTASATDDVDGAITPTCTPASGNTFPVGATTVNCTATDGAGNAASGSFTVTVQDTTPPAITVPGNLTAEATGPTGATVTFTATATDAVSGAITPSCDHISGSVFALGVMTVQCSAADQANNTASGSFTVTVVDTTPPTVTVPPDMTVSTSDPTGTNVSYSASATDLVDGTLTPVCTPASGSLFGRGATEVRCSATDSRGNTGSAAFTVTVEIEAVVDREPPLVSAVTAMPDAPPPNTTVTLTAIVDDTTTGGSQIRAAGYSVNGGAWMSMSASDGAFDSPTETVEAALTFPQAGAYQVCVRGADLQGNTASSSCITVNVTVGGTNTAPTLDPIGGQTVEAGKLLSLTLAASDPDGDNLSFTASGLPAGASLTDHGDRTATLAWMPQPGQVGSYPVTITVTDDGLPPKSDSEQITINVTADAGQTAVLCSRLGNNTGRLPDEDVFRFEGMQGEQVVVTLTPNPNGSYSAGGAYLSLFRRNAHLATDRSVLPNQITMTLAVTSRYYRVSVMEDPPWVRRTHFTGDYCITLKSSGNAYKTLRPEALSVE